MNLMKAIFDSIRTHDLEALKKIHFEDDKALIRTKPAAAGGTWMHKAAAIGSPEILDWLLTVGFNPDEKSTFEKDRPICRAAARGNSANTKWLLAQNVTLDTDASVRNPLFAAVVGQSPCIVKSLLDASIDAEVRYNSPTMKKMDAMAFALFRSTGIESVGVQIATIIARKLSNNDVAKMHRLLSDAEKRARENGAPKSTRLVPTKEEVENMRWD